jgi:hypothetical protein
MTTLYLYSTLGCHLCEVARDLVLPLLADSDFCLQEVEISDSEALMARYGVRIPVLARADDQREIGWPFDQQQVLSLLAGQG